MSDNAVGWFEIYVQDTARARRFYESVLQVTLQKLNTPNLDAWAFPMNAGKAGASGALVRMIGAPSAGTSTLVYFSCVDCAVEEARIQTAGGHVHLPKRSIGEYGYITLARDTEGNMIGLHSLR